ncbi:MAG: hypothetical protein Q7K39_04765 [Candidatus Magasanikbacteria bacterium]|nr:hypothetical protein [Candidatus Magasanikbacteria bacterium]
MMAEKKFAFTSGQPLSAEQTAAVANARSADVVYPRADMEKFISRTAEYILKYSFENQEKIDDDKAKYILPVVIKNIVKLAFDSAFVGANSRLLTANERLNLIIKIASEGTAAMQESLARKIMAGVGALLKDPADQEIYETAIMSGLSDDYLTAGALAW